MTISKSNRKYSIDKDPPPPKTVCIGISLITTETYTVIIDERAVDLPVDDEVVFLTVSSEIVNRPNGGSDWAAIALLLEKEGYLRKHFTIQSVWECVPSHITDEIF